MVIVVNWFLDSCTAPGEKKKNTSHLLLRRISMSGLSGLH